jgi:hypothetical protein
MIHIVWDASQFRYERVNPGGGTIATVRLQQTGLSKRTVTFDYGAKR